MALDDLNLRNPINIGYYDPFNIYPAIKGDLESKLPLTNLHWKYHESKPLKSIPLLPVKLVEEVPKATPKSATNGTGTGSDGPFAKLSYSEPNIYTRIMFVKYDNLDTYRSQVRPLIKEWLRNLVAKHKSEWMIVFYVPQNSKDKSSTIIKTSTFDKLKIDFRHDGKEIHSLNEPNLLTAPSDIDRCFKLKEVVDDKTKNQESTTELINLTKKLLLSSFNNKYSGLSTEAHATESVTALNEFIKRLTLADLLNDMRLSQDSLNIYNELYRDLDQLYLKDPTLFIVHNAFASNDFSNFNFESEDQISYLKSNLFDRTNNKINLIELKSLIFINQSFLLQSLANAVNVPISILAIHLSTLYQKLCYFLNDLKSSVKEEDSLAELIIVTIDRYLNLPIYQKLAETNNHNNEHRSDEHPYQLNEILEFRGELTLLKRSKIVEIAESKGYYINGFKEILEDIPLDDEQTKPSKVWKFSYPPLKNIFKSEDSYFTEYEELTVSTIQDFIHCHRPKSIDVLSIDIAILNYHKGKYLEALNVLQDSYDFFILNGWSFMGAVLLEIYMDCVERLRPENHELILVTCLKLFASLHSDIVSENKFGINNYKAFKHSKSIVGLFAKLKEQSSQMNESVAFPIESIFHTSIIPFIKADESARNTYYLEVELANAYEIEFNFDSMSLELYSSENGERISFSALDVHINKSKLQRIRLHTNNFVMGKFVPSKLELSVNDSLQLLQVYAQHLDENDVEDEMDPDTTVIKYSSTVVSGTAPNREFYSKRDQTSTLDFYFYQNLNKLWCEFVNVHTVELGVTEMVLRIHNASESISDVRVLISSGTEGLKLNCEPFKANIIEGLSSVDIKVPYNYYSDNKIVNMRSSINYESGGEHFSHKTSELVDSALKISVSVQDIFRSDYIYSKFQVGTSNPRSPLKIVGNKLTTVNENYTILSPSTKVKELIAFGEQPASIFYKIIPASGYSVSSQDTMDLAVDYYNLNDECLEYASDYFITQLSSLQLQHYWFLISSLIFPQFKFDLTHFALNFEVKLTNQAEIEQLAEVVLLRYVEARSDQLKVHKLFKSERIPINGQLTPKSHQLRISVPMPILKYLHMVEFHYERHPQYLVGEPIEVDLCIETVTKWFSDPSESPTESFQLQIQNDDNWLLSGFKKHTFSLAGSNKTRLMLVLIPLNVGKVLLPKVTIRPTHSLPENDFSMDVSVRNGLETVLVVPAVDRITFSF